MNRRIQNLIADAATQIYNLGIASTDKPAHERFGLIVAVMQRTVAEALEERRERMLKDSPN
jgi:hypothetical protein